jgi:hypothetical protein
MTDHWLSWQAEQAGTNRDPSVGAVLLLLAVVALVLLALLGGPTATTDSGQVLDVRQAPPSTVPACARHWPPTCQKAPAGR